MVILPESHLLPSGSNGLQGLQSLIGLASLANNTLNHVGIMNKTKDIDINGVTSGGNINGKITSDEMALLAYAARIVSHKQQMNDEKQKNHDISGFLEKVLTCSSNVALPSVQQRQRQNQQRIQQLHGRLDLIQQQPKQDKQVSVLRRLLVSPSNAHLVQKPEPLPKCSNSVDRNGKMLDSLMQLLIMSNKEQTLRHQQPDTVSMQSSPQRKELQKARIPLTAPKKLSAPTPFTLSSCGVKRTNNNNISSRAEKKPRDENNKCFDAISMGGHNCTTNVKYSYPMALKNLYPKDENGFSIIPCSARARPKEHNNKTAFFMVALDNIKHGDELTCSDCACSNTGVKFLWCSTCCGPVAKRNFKKRHAHNEIGTSTSYIPRAVQEHAKNSLYCEEINEQILADKSNLERGRKRRIEENSDRDEEVSNYSDHHEGKREVILSSLLNSPAFVQSSQTRNKDASSIALSPQPTAAQCAGQPKTNEAKEHSPPKICTVNYSLRKDSVVDRNDSSISKPHHKDKVEIMLRKQMWHDLLNKRPPRDSQEEQASNSSAMSKWLLSILTISDSNKSINDLVMLKM